MKLQQGLSLITVLGLTAILLLLSRAIVEHILLDTRAQQNYIQKSLALNHAENTLGEVKAWLSSLSKEPMIEPKCSMGFCITHFNITSKINYEKISWWQTHAYFTKQHSYVLINLLQQNHNTEDNSLTNYYEITILAQNDQDIAQTVIKVVVMKKFNLENPDMKIAVRQTSWHQL